MRSIGPLEAIFWDFDGVLMDSMPVRNAGFRTVLADYPKDQVDSLMEFHLANGGLSRYVKFRYFFEEIREEPITNEEVNQWASKFSSIMIKSLINPDLLLFDSNQFVKQYADQLKMHIVSGSDQNELIHICESLELSRSFVSIKGSPTTKKDLVRQVLAEHQYDRKKTILIGDSINDYEAANENQILFGGYNNEKLRGVGQYYIDQLSQVKMVLAGHSQ
ncbi:haloacid dehalogenase [Roseivirga sp. 4D4]|uniref:HAD family hydrolase n=1 Tax=Roseivirga sp. 4D4 TaxID=1889784 RepID=UPI000852F836|nr:HAD hydrolase-like protein [Roseivirga sp. 4D4]OEK01636.1 haloacid dehalogenase [Roseivirga sp. 4D4]